MKPPPPTFRHIWMANAAAAIAMLAFVILLAAMFQVLR
jgi:hypothetical protein